MLFRNLITTILIAAGVVAHAQQPPAPGTAKAPPLERLGPDSVRVGNVTVNTARKEVSVAGTVNDVTTLEFIANTKGGFKAYESALELETDAINFNLGLILIGLDHSRAIPSRFPLDPNPPRGDLVEIFVEWEQDGLHQKIRAEQLVYNDDTKQTLSEGPWVYTGSAFAKERNAYLADLDGCLIGFIHSNAPVIESMRPLATGPYGTNRLNTKLNLKPGTKVVLTVRALPRDK